MTPKKLVLLEEAEGRFNLHLNNLGIDYLIEQLQLLKNTPAPEDIILMSKEWGGELEGDPKHIEGEILNIIKLMKWED
ncbi:MAG: hypothetical protein OCD01_05360 [Fibrobacterales bacterium]